MSERDYQKSKDFNSQDKEPDEDYYFEEIDEAAEENYSEESEESGEEYDSDDDEGFREPDNDEKPKKKRKRTRYRGRRKKHKEKKSRKKLWITLGCIAAALAVVYLGVSVFFMSHFFMNTEINGHNFSCKSVADVENYLKDQVQDYKLTVLEKDNKSDTIAGSDISLTYKENDDVQKALKKQNCFAWPAAFFTENNSKVTIDVAFNEDALNHAIADLQSVKAKQIPPKSAYPKYDGEKYVVEPEVVGTTVNKDILSKKVHQFIMEFRKELDMQKEGCYAEPKYTTESDEVKKACDTMNNYIKASITYNMNEPVVVDKALISQWLTVDDNMQVKFDENAVKQWLTAFGNKYDTVGTSRTITTPTGKVAEVSGGTYGWSIDEDKEYTALTDSIKKGETVTKEPAYLQTAASHSPQDWGTTYVEVDISAQHMWYISNGKVEMESDVVTGLPTPDKETPIGVYSILEVQKNKTLIGDIVPSTGKPEYETPVDFWMRVTWSGVGLHDAPWQPGFGGSLYDTIGSHGCINMPPDKAQTLYGMISVGTPVVIHN